MNANNDIDFMFEMAFNKKLPSFYDSAFHPNNNTALQLETELKMSEIDNTICTVFDIPSHLKVSKKPLPANIGVKKIIQHKGYYIDLNGYQNIDDYIKNQFSRSSRQALRSGKKRLKICFDISYKMYFGSIDKTQYDSLFIQFYDMLKLRANEKGIDNKNLQHWEFYTSTIYKMILKKEASLFVIYDGEKPINISLNLHLKDIVFLFITTYNIDYSKFRIGHTNWTWLIDWFLKNDIKIIDFSKGNTAYKKRWANKNYDFEYHLFHNKSNAKSNLKAMLLENKLKLKQTLRNKNINDYYYTTLNKLARNKKYQHLKNHKFSKTNQLPSKGGLSKILIQENNQFNFLRPVIYQYLYLKSTNIKDIEIYQSNKNNRSFFIKIKSEVLKLSIKD